MNTRIEIRCPNCGSLAQRILSDRLTIGCNCPSLQVTQTECPTCDYFMTTCSQNGAVLEAYAPGIQENDAAATTHRISDRLLRYLLSSMRLSPSELLSGQY
ncbi:hypothetical protein H6F44_10240 [Pseudanabaena sp. FACHB-1277]|jgi:hypothetical protein|uniref:Replication restart DNA helicase PriA n=1 Tax=Pseudanabaena cinerea FACHB-1277 TaxID=2949581 RepID=A0A926USN0_9CYAN|nr:hypothetical protein [Pseudanabaena cinerea]MBD2150495.1 hypothetical protein [Pseudanabaena cinerea FACHB-1277]